MTSSVLSVELVNVAYERMNDCPAHWSVLIADAGDGDASRTTLERLLVDGDGRHRARLQVHLALQAEAEAAQLRCR